MDHVSVLGDKHKLKAGPEMHPKPRRGSSTRKESSPSIGRNSSSKKMPSGKRDDIKDSKAPTIKKIKSTAGLMKENTLGLAKPK